MDSEPLLSPADVAKHFQISEEKVLELRRAHDWPHVRLGRQIIRFTAAQVDQIIKDHTVETEQREREIKRLMTVGLTRRSATHHTRRRSGPATGADWGGASE